jgi:hypothetical protein
MAGVSFKTPAIQPEVTVSCLPAPALPAAPLPARGFTRTSRRGECRGGALAVALRGKRKGFRSTEIMTVFLAQNRQGFRRNQKFDASAAPGTRVMSPAFSKVSTIWTVGAATSKWRRMSVRPRVV